MFARIASLCLLALGPGGFAEAARPGCELPLERWNRLVVTHDEGLPLDTVNALAEDGHGFLWVGTEDGLARFDGREFDRVDLGPALDYAAEIIQALEPGDAGTLHVGTLSSGVVEVHTRGPALPSKTSALDPRVFDLARAPDGRVLAATGGNGLLITVPGGDTEEPRTGRAGDAARVVAPRARGGWWVGYDGLGLQWFDGERFHDVPAAETLEDAFVTALTETHDGALWIGTREGLFTLDDAGARRIDALPADAFVRALLQDSDGRLWLGTDDGAVARLCEGRFDVLAEPAGPGSAFVSDLIEDHAGGIWVATGGSGIVRLESHGVVPLTPRHGVPEAPVLPIVEDAHGTLWLGTFGGGIAGFADGRVTRLTADDGLPSDRVLSLLPARGGVWVGTRSGLAEVRDGTVQRAWASLEGLSHLTIGAMADDGDTLWLGTLAGLVAFDDEGMRIVERDFGAPITALRVDRGGTLWIGTDGEGAFVRRPGGPIEPAPFSDRLPSPAIMALYESRSASLWVATALGLLRWDGQRAVVIDRRHGLPESRAFSIAEDGLGGFWLSGNRGVFRLDAAEMEAFEPAGPRHLSPALRIDADDGMPRTETNGGFQPAVWRDGRGRLWYPTSSGAARVDPAAFASPEPPEQPVILSVRLDGDDLDPSGPLRLSARPGVLELSFASPTWRRVDRVEYVYRLHGYDEDWLRTGDGRTLYRQLPPGEYRFEVRARRDDRATSPATELPVRVARHPLDGPWPGIAAALVLSVGLFVLVIAAMKRRDRRRTLEQRQHRLADAARFTEAVAGDFTVVLDAVAESARTIDRRLPDESPLRDEARMIVEATERARGYTHRLRSFSGHDAGTPAWVDLQSEVRDMRRFVERLVPHDVRIVWDLSHCGWCLIDPVQFQQALIHLVLSARDAIEGHGDIRISLVHCPQRLAPAGGKGDGWARLSVQDSGSLDTTSRMPSSARAGESDDERAPQVDLSIAASIVSAAGGETRARPEADRGMRIDAYLPVSSRRPADRDDEETTSTT